MTSPTIQPFANDASSADLGGLTVENGTASIAVYGQTDLTRDRVGLDKARALLGFVQALVHVLEADAALPAKVATAKPPGTAKNPFS